MCTNICHLCSMKLTFFTSEAARFKLSNTVKTVVYSHEFRPSERLQ